MNIDFVIPWVDDSDLEWKKEKQRYNPEITELSDASEARYREWDNLRYWFRAVEKFAPWVHKVFFVTCGHVPEWLNLQAPKLVHVKHADYIPKEYLPTFSSHPIELNLHRIQSLSEHFVYFNDDTFLTQPVSPDLFFTNGLPNHPAILHGVFPRGEGGIMPHVYLSTIMAVNRHFDMKRSMNKNWKKWYSIRKTGPSGIVENLYNNHYQEFPGFKNAHLPTPVLKQTMFDAWKEEKQLLIETSKHRFRDLRDVNMYLFRYWELASGNFEPIRIEKLGIRVDVGDNIDAIYHMIISKKYPMICLNDMDLIKDEDQFQNARDMIKDAFEQILPNKSSFEL